MIDAGLWVLLGRLIAGIIGIPSARMSGVPTILFVSGILLYLLSVAIHYVVLAMEASRAAHKRADEARVLAGRAELRALRAQINPHFLYNSLNSISALTSIDPAKARDMCIQLSDFLRNTLGLSELSSIPLHQEMDLVRGYLAIERVRFGKRLIAGEQIPEECLPDLVPPLILQPLVENAIVHGIAGVLEEGVLQLTAEHTADGKLRLVVENSFDPDAKKRRQTEFGLASIRKRLQVIYGHEASLKVSTVRDLFRVELAVPRTQE
jgi:LytS/YehU family sensor histidine kinase